jgi:hypothetical protein
MFIEKVAYIVWAELPEDFDERIKYNSYFANDNDGAYYEIDTRLLNNPCLPTLMDMNILDEEEVKEIVDQDVAYIMLYSPS